MLLFFFAVSIDILLELDEYVVAARLKVGEKAGAVSIEGEKVTDAFASLAPDDLKGKVLKVGKHQFRKIV